MTVPPVFGLPHLSEDAVAACADGVLSEAAAARARRHCAECHECAEAVRVQRETTMLLRTAGSPTLPSGLLDRLAGLPMSTPLPPPRSGLPTAIGADGIPVFIAHDARPRPAEPRPQPAERRPQPAERRAESPSVPHPASASDTGRPHARSHGGRRALLPVGILASAAAVVAAGAIGSNASTPTRVPPQPASVNLSTDLFGSQRSTVPAPPPGTTLIPVHRLLATTPEQAAHPAPRTRP